MDLIDRELAREQFEALDPDMAERLRAAMESDFRKWVGLLVDAWEGEDQDGIHRARHSLKGLCGNFGADVLAGLSYAPLSTAGARDRLLTCLDETIHAIKTAAGPEA